MDGGDYSLQIVVTNWNSGENSSNFLLPGEDKIITHGRECPGFNPPSLLWNGVTWQQCFVSSPDIPNVGLDPEGKYSRWIIMREGQSQLKLCKSHRRGEQKLHPEEINTKIHANEEMGFKWAASTLELVPGVEISDVTDATSTVTSKEFQHRSTETSGIR